MELEDVKQYLKSNKDGVDLVLKGKQLRSLPDLASFKKLEHIDVEGNCLETLDFLSGVTTLKGLNINRKYTWYIVTHFPKARPFSILFVIFPFCFVTKATG